MSPIIELAGAVIQAVYVVPGELCLGGYDAVLVVTQSQGTLWIEPLLDTEELRLQLRAKDTLPGTNTEQPDWAAALLGKKIVGQWAGPNQQGYDDLFALGLDAFVPTVLFTCISSQVQVGLVGYVKA
ncbi:hypothetical protein GCM10023185_05410 [Hymenobacter saemangeumensis]|uniref:Uncharacterized protein n=1 Tax=Hymenobacter saemangeumensis TaxID=1084522 RepID=A0ABP8I1A9_9BACT